MTELWTEKHSPKSLNEVIGNSNAIEKIKQWATAWSKGKKQKPLFLHGVTGIGKTAAVQALVNDFDFELLELNASDDRDAKKIEKIAGLSSVSATFSGKKRLILFDEIDGLLRIVNKAGEGCASAQCFQAQTSCARKKIKDPKSRQVLTDYIKDRLPDLIGTGPNLQSLRGCQKPTLHLPACDPHSQLPNS